jgi:hypothetical protein
MAATGRPVTNLRKIPAKFGDPLHHTILTWLIGYNAEQWYLASVVRLTPNVISLQLCILLSPKVVGV